MHVHHLINLQVSVFSAIKGKHLYAFFTKPNKQLHKPYLEFPKIYITKMGSMTRAFILIAMVACLTSVSHAIAGQATFYTPPYIRKYTNIKG